MDRTAAQNTLSEKYRELVTYAKFTNDQTTAAYNAAIDMALRYLGVAESDLAGADVAQVDTLKYLALLDYFALDRFSTLLSVQFDVTLPGPVQADRSQAFKQVGTLLARAENKLASLGISIGANGGSDTSMQFGRFNLDFLEPSRAGSEF
jgi:hypothetical protein